MPVGYTATPPKSFNQDIGTGLAALSQHVCSEVLIMNRSGGDLNIFSSNNFNPQHVMLLLDNESMTMRGVSNSNELSASMPSGSGKIYYRALAFSNNYYTGEFPLPPLPVPLYVWNDVEIWDDSDIWLEGPL